MEDISKPGPIQSFTAVSRQKRTIEPKGHLIAFWVSWGLMSHRQFKANVWKKMESRPQAQKTSLQTDLSSEKNIFFKPILTP